MAFSWKDRQDALGAIQSHLPELIILGGGVVGASIAAHAARLGLRVILIEKEDLAAGASGRSTGLAHAGLRYLAQGRLGYVFREGRERRRLQEIAPQWVRPFNFILPVYRDDAFPFWKVRLGTWIYDLLGWTDNILTKTPWTRRHRTLKSKEVLARVPGLRQEKLVGGIEYYVDARLLDARFTLGYAQQAAQYGAKIITHAELLSATPLSDGRIQVECRDMLGDQRFKLTAPLVINSTGAWIDEVRTRAGMAGQLLRPSRGIHLIVDLIAYSPLIMSSAVKGKVFFVLPIDSERSLVGTTDSPISGAIDAARPDQAEIMELLQQLFFFFPYLKQGPHLQEAMSRYREVHVRSIVWAVRPLLFSSGPTLHASREHRLVEDLPGFWSVPGVKLTAARAAGYECAVKAWEKLRTGVPRPAVTFDSLPGGELWDFDRFAGDAQRRFKLGEGSEEAIRYLVGMYGTRYVEVLQWAQRDAEFNDLVLSGEPWLLAEAAYAAHEEMVLTLNDFLFRRTKWALYRDLPSDVLARITGILARFLGWNDERQKKEIEDYHREREKHRLA